MSDDFKLQISIKTKSGTLVNLRGGSEDELSEQLQSFANLIPQLDEVESLVAAMKTVYQVMGPDRGGAPSGGGNAAPRQAQAPAQAPAVGGKTCAHGEMVYREGNGARGPWKGYFCPTQKGDPTQCKPEFIRG